MMDGIKQIMEWVVGICALNLRERDKINYLLMIEISTSQEVNHNKYGLHAKFGRDYGIKSPEFMPAELHYLYVFLFDYYEKEEPDNENAEPIMLTFEDEQTTFHQLLKRIHLKHHPEKGWRYHCFTLSTGNRIGPFAPVASLAKITRLKRNDGVVLFVQKEEIPQGQKSWIDSNQVIINECAMQTHLIKNLSEDQMLNMSINFELPGPGNYILTIRISDLQTVLALKNKFLSELKKHFDVQLEANQIKALDILRKDQQPMDMLLILQRQICGVDYLVNNCTVKLVLKKSAKVDFDRKLKGQGTMIAIIKEDHQKVKFILEEIQFMTFGILYKTKLKPINNKKSKSDFVCLKVMDIIVTQHESLSKISQALRNKRENEVLDMVGWVVTEKMYFYKNMEELSQKQDFKFEIGDIITPGVKTEERDQFRQRIRHKIQSITERSNQQHFKDSKSVEPIYIYTCEDAHYADDSNPQQSEPVYTVVNRHLRDDYIFNKPFKKLSEDWRYLFTNSLIKELREINPALKKTVYRAVSYGVNVQKGDVMTFKSFTSTTLREAATIPFQKGDCTLFQLQIFNGKGIKDYSDFVEEDEVLLEPFTQFRVTKVIETPEKTVKRRIFLTQLDEKESSASYPQSVANFILWVDDKTVFEGYYLYKEIADFKHPTILIHFQSTEELSQWLNAENNQQIMMDPTANIVMISNMKRQDNELAGIQAIIELQKCKSFKEIPIFMYIGYVEGAVKKIKDNQSRLKNIDKIKVGNDPKQVQKFIIMAMGEPEQEKLPEQKDLSPKLKANSVANSVAPIKKGNYEHLTKSMDSNQNSSVKSKKDKQICCIM